MTLASFQFHWRKDIYSGHIEKPTEWLTVHAHAHLPQPRRKTSRIATNCLRTRLTFIHCNHRATSRWQYTNLILVDHGVKINVMWSVTVVPACYTSNLKHVFIFQASAECAPAYTALRQSAFLPVTPLVRQTLTNLKKFFQSRLNSKFVTKS